MSANPSASPSVTTSVTASVGTSSNMLRNAVITPILMLLVLTVLLGGVYPLVMTVLSGALFPSQAGGSLITNSNGQVVGSSLLAQPFTDPKYFWPRPSAVNYGIFSSTQGAACSSANASSVTVAGGASAEFCAGAGSNLGPTSATLLAQIQQRAKDIRAANNLSADAVIPSDLLFASASGLDPHISPAAAQIQIDRVAKARNMTHDQVAALVTQFTQQPQLGILGEARVNVLLLNLALDQAK